MRSLLPLLIACIATTSASAQSLQPRQLSDGLFVSMDRNGDGNLVVEEAHAFNDDMLLSMDTDENGAADLDEFLAWGVGFMAAADMRMRVEALEIANRIMFELMDANNDGRLTATELDAFQTQAFSTADSDGSAGLDSDEFYDRHFINIASRVALGQS